MGQLKSAGKSFDISKWEVWEAYGLKFRSFEAVEHRIAESPNE
jgi:hypothetical protein